MKAKAEAQKKQAEEAAAKQQEENGLGINAPLSGATIEEVSKWIDVFKAEHMEPIIGDVAKFKASITTDLANKLVSRVDQWVRKHSSQSSKYNNFKKELYAAYNQSFC